MAQQRGRGTRRVWVPAAVFLVFAAVIGLRLVQVQVVQHGNYADRARVTLLGDDTLYARRGAILDRNGTPLATSVDTWDIYVNSRVWKEAARANRASEELGRLLGLEAPVLRARVAGTEAIDILIERDVDYDLGRRIIAGGIPGVVALPNTDRVHAENDIAAAVLGFTGQDNTGLTGIEAQYNEVLQGKPGKAVYERDSLGAPIPFGRRVREAPIPGKDVVLTIDRYLQQLAEQALDRAIEEHGAKGGAIIMMEPSTGEILAMASRPGLKYSTLDLSDASQTEFFRNRTVTDLYEPGSVMKVITMAAALDQGVVTPNTTYVDTGVAYAYGVPIRNWDYHVYGTQTMTGVLQHSINTGAVFMVGKLGQQTFHTYLDAFGFGAPTGIDLSGEAPGIIRRPSDPGWSPVDLATQSFGQSLSVTPIQLTTAVAAAINGGMVVTPHLVKAFVLADGRREEAKSEARGRAISAATSATIRAMMVDVIDPGWYHPGKPKAYTAGGKSGTASIPAPNGYALRSVASFVGFAPAENPKILVLVKIDENADLMTGTQAAAPVFSKLVDESLHYLNVRPDDPKYVSGAR